MIENRQPGKACETLLLSHQGRQPSHRKLQDHTRSLRMNNQASIDLGMLHHARSELHHLAEGERPEDCQPSHESVERYIAVPISATEQYLISSTGQTYLTEKLPGVSSPVTSRTAEPGERLPPIGALSRTTSKMSLDILDEETQC